MNTTLQELVMKGRRIRFDEVRSEGKLLVSLLRGWEMIQPVVRDPADSSLTFLTVFYLKTALKE